MNTPHVYAPPTRASVIASIAACNAERRLANAQVPELNLPYEPYPVTADRSGVSGVEGVSHRLERGAPPCIQHGGENRSTDAAMK